VNSVIPEVDFALRSLIEREAANGTEVEVVFDAPTKDWAGRRNVPTIDVYLYDIREDLRRRERGLVNEYDGERIRSRRLPPRHFKLSYLVTAWTQRPEDEHRLLSALLSCFLRHDAMPEDLLTGPLADLGLPVPITVSLPPPEDRSFADVWSALGGELKPSLDVVISAPTDTGQQYLAAPPVVSPGVVSLGGVGEWPPRESRTRAAVASGAGQGRAVGDTGSDSGHSDSGHSDSGHSDSGRARQSGGSQGLTWEQLAASGSAGPATPESSMGGEVLPHKGSDDPEEDRSASAGRPRRRRQGGISQR